MRGGDRVGTFELSLGRNVTLGTSVVLEIWARADTRLRLDDDVRVMNGVRLEPRTGSIEVGPRTCLRDLSLLKSDGVLTVGGDVLLGRGSFVHCAERVEIGDHTATGEWVSIADSDHSPDGSDTPLLEQPLRIDPVRVERNVFLGRGTAVLRGARIGRNAVVGANAVVTAGEYPPGQVLAGMPAKPVRRLPSALEGEPSQELGATG